jgi:hypothetical protein
MWRSLAVGFLMLAVSCKKDEGITDVDEKPKTKKPKVEKPEQKLAEPKSHRASKQTCSNADTPPPTTTTFAPRMPIADGPACKSKADCKEQANGRCAAGHCTYDGCYDEKDCGNKVCQCDQEGKRGYYCKGGDCAVDSDCGSNGYCSPTYGMSCGAFTGVVGYYCHTKEDECSNDDECVKGKEHGYCAYDPDQKHWRCGYGHCVG